MSKKAVAVKVGAGIGVLAVLGGVYAFTSNPKVQKSHFHFLDTYHADTLSSDVAVIPGDGVATEAVTKFDDRFNIKAEFDQVFPVVRQELLHAGFVEDSADATSPNSHVFKKKNPRDGWAEESVTVRPGKNYAGWKHLAPPTGPFLVREPWCAVIYTGTSASIQPKSLGLYVKAQLIAKPPISFANYMVASAPKNWAEAKQAKYHEPKAVSVRYDLP